VTITVKIIEFLYWHPKPVLDASIKALSTASLFKKLAITFTQRLSISKIPPKPCLINHFNA